MENTIKQGKQQISQQMKSDVCIFTYIEMKNKRDRFEQR